MFKEVPKNAKLRIDVFDEDITSDDFIGGGFLAIDKFLEKPNNPTKEKVNLIYEGKLSGVILLEVDY